jgi:AraC-like DNA-binding protein
MSGREQTAIARVPVVLARSAQDRFGLEADASLREAGFTDVELHDADARIPISKLRRLWGLIARRVPDPAVGVLLAENRPLREIGLVAYTMQLAKTLGEALQRLARYSHVVSEDLTVEVHRRGDRAEVELDRTFLYDPIRPPVDARLTLLLCGIRALVRDDLAPLEARFPYPAPTDLSALRRVFRCPLHFGKPTAALVLAAAKLERPVPTADEVLLSYLDRLAEQARRELYRSDSTADGVQRVLWQELASGSPSIGTVAARLGLSARSLQRRLAEQGTSFKGVLEGFRREAARRLLSERQIAVSEVAFLLGYADPSAFHRAFQRWHGSTPRRFRSRMP